MGDEQQDQHEQRGSSGSANGGGLFASLGPEATRYPHQLYSAMSTPEGALRIDGVGVLVTGRAAADEVFRHPDVFSSNQHAADLGSTRPLIPLQIDPPEHKKYRRILDPWFSPQQMKPLEGAVAALANQLLDRIEGRDSVDFTAEFSVPLPSQVVLELLGLPQDDLGTFLRLKDGMIRPHEIVGQPADHPDVMAYRRATADEIERYFGDAVDSGSLGGEGGLLARLLTAEIDGERLTRDEIVDICFLMMMAGLDTVSASLDCLIVHLAEHPATRQLLLDDPDRIPYLLEELMRYESPVQMVPRIALSDANLNGCPVHAGDKVTVVIGALNIDSAEFPDPTTVQWDREGNRHVVFGGGVHRCLGSNLARMELRVALREWHRRLPDYRLQPGEEVRYSMGVRSAQRIPLLLG